MDVDRRVAAVERENDLLREQVRRLEAALFETAPLPFEWGLTACEATVFGVLVNRELATKDAVMAALYRDLGRDDGEEKIVDVFVCKVRRKLKPFGVAIHTVWGQGYHLDEATRARFRAGETAVEGA